MVCELGVADQAVPTTLRERMSRTAVSQGRTAALADTPENRSFRTQTSCWPWSETQIWLGSKRIEVGEQVGLATFLELPLSFTAQDQQRLRQLLQVGADGAVARWSWTLWFQAPPIPSQCLIHQPNRQPLTKYLFSMNARTAGWASRNRDLPLSERTRSIRPA